MVFYEFKCTKKPVGGIELEGHLNETRICVTSKAALTYTIKYISIFIGRRHLHNFDKGSHGKKEKKIWHNL
jgi:hypothetical protein